MLGIIVKKCSSSYVQCKRILPIITRNYEKCSSNTCQLVEEITQNNDISKSRSSKGSIEDPVQTSIFYDGIEVIEQPDLVYAEPAEFPLDRKTIDTEDVKAVENEEKSTNDQTLARKKKSSALEFVSVEQRLIDIVDKKMIHFMQGVEKQPQGHTNFNMDLDEEYTTFSGPVTLENIPKKMKNKQKYPDDEIPYAEFKSVLPPSYLVNKIKEIDMNKASTLEPSPHNVKRARKVFKKVDVEVEVAEVEQPEKKTIGSTYDQKVTMFTADVKF